MQKPLSLKRSMTGSAPQKDPYALGGSRGRCLLGAPKRFPFRSYLIVRSPVISARGGLDPSSSALPRETYGGGSWGQAQSFAPSGMHCTHPYSSTRWMGAGEPQPRCRGALRRPPTHSDSASVLAVRGSGRSHRRTAPRRQANRRSPRTPSCRTIGQSQLAGVAAAIDFSSRWRVLKADFVSRFACTRPRLRNSSHRLRAAWLRPSRAAYTVKYETQDSRPSAVRVPIVRRLRGLRLWLGRHPTRWLSCHASGQPTRRSPRTGSDSPRRGRERVPV